MEPGLGVVVVIPFYNGSQWIERAIKSVLEQTVQPEDFVIVNDGSRPEERATLAALTERYPFRIVDKPNGGQGSARNVGVAASTAPYISFLDQDDFYLSRHIEDLLSIIPADDPQLGWVYADCVWADGEGRVVHTNMLKVNPTMHPKVGSIVHVIGADLFILPSASLIRRVAYEAVGGFDEQFTGYEDDDLFGRMFRAGYTNYFLDKAVTVWCRHAGSTSWSVKMSKSRYRYFEKLVKEYVDDPVLENFYFREALRPRFEWKFIDEVERAIAANSPDLPILQQILRDYVAVALAQPSLTSDQKSKLRLETYVLTELPPELVRTMKRITKLPLFRRVVQRVRTR